MYCEIGGELIRGRALEYAFSGIAGELERTIRILKLQLLHGSSVGAIAQCVIMPIRDNGVAQ